MSTTPRGRRGTQTKKRGPAKNGAASIQKPTANSSMRRPNQRQQRRTASSRKSLLFWAITSLIVAVMVAIGVIWFTTHETTGDTTLSGVVTYSNMSRQHVQGTVTYQQNPPVGGSHNPVWQNCGIYTTPVANENAVHSMEHGAVWITYQPELGAQDVAQLQNLVRGHSYALLSPYPGLPTPVVISGWGVQLQVKSANDPRLALFLSKYEQGPQTQEPGAACSGGTGTPDVQ